MHFIHQVHVLPKSTACELLPGGPAELAHLPDDKGASRCSARGRGALAEHIGSNRIASSNTHFACPTTRMSSTPAVRVVEVAGGPCPCGGTHVRNTQELGAVEVTRIKATAKKRLLKVSYKLTSIRGGAEE